ncbi:type 4a pilus biogenesis protein PilO [Alloalcanivorax gelatiniphagus]|uniref:Pilus assembly protein PilP n=1 Tax=Alloalcanivorax gelatiniphagus TaxID=1194167 RepID=A0ABY2XIW4_9GAMM|nr:type 4a pilus biogenesis protein PilO [Alloalcanivorax gelatiniphagus]TMW11846.1 pilus assembly protein PilP [Alloalcanivorax gelatiniphagus]|tara:strand:- start:6916 stop:7596 length:681 start_codon:yes stop_codon:yes gene_type:complete
MKASELKNLDVRELIDELNSLDFENVGGWPLPVKIGAAVLVFGAILFLGYFLAIKDLNARHGQLVREEKTLLDSYEKKAFQAHNLEQYRQQLVEIEASFETLKSQLPRDTEVPGLLEDITHTGLGSGLEFETIELKDEVKKEFYAELPIDIRVIGDYHGFGSFVSGVAALPRIVTLHNFKIEPLKSDNKEPGGLLDMAITAKTYRYAEGGDSGDGNKKQAGKKGRS